eukprot:m.17365 g.17365  ORF g.17365 m.17365 type:complete len:100 (-) comp6000_c0_seq2:33-332(-)
MDTVGQAAGTLHALCDQIFGNIKSATPELEDLLKAAGKYQLAMEAANEAGKVFLRQLSAVGVVACKSRGATAELGSTMQKVVAQHDKVRRSHVLEILRY